jgi:hypothetical protein
MAATKAAPPAEPGATERTQVEVGVGDLGRQPPGFAGGLQCLARIVPIQPPAEPGAADVFHCRTPSDKPAVAPDAFVQMAARRTLRREWQRPGFDRAAAFGRKLNVVVARQEGCL